MKILKIILLALISVQSFGQVIDSVNSGEFTIYYELMGEGKPIYILSGGPGITPQYMKGVSEELSKNYQTILIHQRGTGNTVVPLNEETIQIDKYCQDIKAIKDKLDHDKISLLGHSWGGMLAMHYITSFPDDIGQTILVSSGGYNLDFLKYFGSNIWSKLSEEDQQVFNVYNEFLEHVGELETNDSLQYALARLSLDMQNIWVKGYLFDKSYANQIQLSEKDLNHQIVPHMFGSLIRTNWNLKDNLTRLKNTKTLIVQGRQDPIDLETAIQINDAINGSQLKIIESCGHFPWIEKPEEFFSIINDFMINN